MEKIIVEAKTIEEAKNNALEKLNAQESEAVIVSLEEKKGLFSKKAQVLAITKEDLHKDIKNFVSKLVKDMGITSTVELKVRDDSVLINIITKDSAILIGKNGRTIDALQTITNSYLLEELKEYYRVTIDVNDYKQKKTRRLEKLAKYTAKEVAKSKVEVKLDPMNSYERRIIHNALTNSKDVKTESTGEEPNRCVVIKPIED